MLWKMGHSCWFNALILLFLFIHKITGTCEKNAPDSRGLHQVKCVCPHSSTDLEITPEQSVLFQNATAVEISCPGNVILHSNLFRKASNLHKLSVFNVNNLTLDPALSLPFSLKSFRLSNIGFLDHFPVPGPHSAVFLSVGSLDTFSLNNVTVRVDSKDSSFKDLLIENIHLNGIKFVGTISKDLLHFNGKSLNEFIAVRCHFDEMDEGALVIQSKGNVTIEGSTFKKLSQGSVKVNGQYISLINNVFEKLDGAHAISVEGKLHTAVMYNCFKNLGSSHSMLLSADENSDVWIENNELPCNCYARSFISPLLKNGDVSNCRGYANLPCALLKEQSCISHRGKNESILIYKRDSPPCPEPSSSGPLLLSHHSKQSSLLLFTIYFIMHML